MQSGSLQRLHQQWFHSSAAECSSNVVFTPLSLPGLFAVIIIIPLACLFSGVMLSGELVFTRLTSRGRRPRGPEVLFSSARPARRRWSIEGAGGPEVAEKLARNGAESAGSIGSTWNGVGSTVTKRPSKVAPRYQIIRDHTEF